MAAYFDFDAIAEQSVYIAKPHGNYSALFILSLLNSALAGYYFRCTANEFDEQFPQMKVKEFGNLPLRYIDFADPAEKSQHDMLIRLAQEMLDMNKASQKEQRRFLCWVEDQLHILPNRNGNRGIEALSNKTKIKGYLGDYQKGEDVTDFADILKVLQKNKSRIHGNLSDAAFVRMLEREYKKSLEILLPISSQ